MDQNRLRYDLENSMFIKLTAHVLLNFKCIAIEVNNDHFVHHLQMKYTTVCSFLISYASWG